jgi:hypothetical protein
LPVGVEERHHPRVDAGRVVATEGVGRAFEHAPKGVAGGPGRALPGGRLERALRTRLLALAFHGLLEALDVEPELVVVDHVFDEVARQAVGVV